MAQALEAIQVHWPKDPIVCVAITAVCAAAGDEGVLQSGDAVPGEGAPHRGCKSRAQAKFVPLTTELHYRYATGLER